MIRLKFAGILVCRSSSLSLRDTSPTGGDHVWQGFSTQNFLKRLATNSLRKVLSVQTEIDKQSGIFAVYNEHCNLSGYFL